MEILTFADKDCLMMVDYLSTYPEVMEIHDKAVSTIVKRMIEIFARNGIPEKVMTDSIPFTSHELRYFKQKRRWGIKQHASSLGLTQSNRQGERFVQTIKSMMKKADGDRYLSLLEYRNTPDNGHIILSGSNLDE